MLVRIVKDWNYPESFFSQTPQTSKQWGEIEFTEATIQVCDYLIVLQRPPYDITVTCPEGNTWLITQEPPVDYFRFYIRSFNYFDKVFSYYKDIKHPHLRTIQPVLPWHVLQSYDELVSITKDKLSMKRSELVWITSNKNSFPGQRARMHFREYLVAGGFPFQLYGTGFHRIQNKFDGLFPFKYALAIENYSTDHYWTEKIADSFLSWCLPFYWGAENLEDYFPPESFIRIDIHKPAKALAVIKKAIENKEWEKRLDAIEVARNLVLNEYQFFPYISQLIKEDILNKPEAQKKNYFIPRNPYPWRYTMKNQVKYYVGRVLQFLRWSG